MIGQMFEKRLLICGCGSILWGDDGFGPAVVNRLNQQHDLPDDVLALDVGTSIRDLLFDLALSEAKPQKLIIVDAVEYPDRQPGEVFEIPVEGIPAHKTHDFSLHQFPTVNILKELKDHTAIDVKVIVGQVEIIPEEVKPGLSRTMEKAVAVACARLWAEITEAEADSFF
jgi:coenzyme F420 hydrogenase subunit delta